MRTRWPFSSGEMLALVCCLLLVAGVHAAWQNADWQGRRLALVVQLQAVERGMVLFHADCMRFPSVQEGIAVLLPEDSPEWQSASRPECARPEGYVDASIHWAGGTRSMLKDPWGTPLVLQGAQSDDAMPLVLSFGADRMPGGGGLDQDLSNQDVRN